MPRSGTGEPTDPDASPAQLRAKAAHMRRLARDFQDNDRRLMLEFAEELDLKASQVEQADC